MYHLGDVIFKKQGTLGMILSELPGKKILCIGNHDNNARDWYVKKGFDSVYDYVITSCGILLSHHPLDICEIEKTHSIPIKFNIHGHFHNKVREELTRSASGYPFYSEKHLLLSIERENYKPVLLENFTQDNM